MTRWKQSIIHKMCCLSSSIPHLRQWSVWQDWPVGHWRCCPPPADRPGWHWGWHSGVGVVTCHTSSPAWPSVAACWHCQPRPLSPTWSRSHVTMTSPTMTTLTTTLVMTPTMTAPTMADQSQPVVFLRRCYGNCQKYIINMSGGPFPQVRAVCRAKHPWLVHYAKYGSVHIFAPIWRLLNNFWESQYNDLTAQSAERICVF